MNDLIVSEFVKAEGKQTSTTSMIIAEKFDKEHKNVIRDIKKS